MRKRGYMGTKNHEGVGCKQHIQMKETMMKIKTENRK
jgi:hypothetical protein